MKNIILKRIEELKNEFEKGQARLLELQQQQSHLHETLLRIGGALQVMDELLEKEAAEPQNKDAKMKS